ncbi:MAG: outer membrane beta-barrel protein [Deltaproteobacteria bacterium]|nr:outer membrane beta-barrel protein [Deltaproteobacteria bacterium]MBN2670231.1 outer membrane beta-barrel protein [Deltaproteobacteria bacterium]
MKFVSVVPVLFVVVALSSTAHAQTVWLDVGAKGGVGGNYLSPPDDFAFSNVAAFPFEDGAGGLGGGGGIFADVRFLKQYLGLEVGFLFEGNKNWCSITYNDVVDVDYIYRYSKMRIPILLKGSVVRNKTRVSLGIGPEIQAGLGSSADIEVTDGEQYVSDADVQDLKSAFRTSDRTDVALAFDFGVAIGIAKLALTIDFRLAYNLSMPSAYDERVGDYTTGTFNTEAASTLDGRILVGLAYGFAFGDK